MKTFLKRIFKYESPADKFITVNKQANLLHKKEQEIYKKTKEFEKKSPLTAGLDYLLYDFQVYCEFIEKYKKQFGLKYDNDFYDLLDNLTLVKRFLEIGYYGSAGMYIRKAFEDWSKMFSTDKSSTKFSELFRNTICLKKSDDGPMQFDSREVYKLYIYLSENYTHCHLNFEDIKFNSKEYFEIKNLLIIIIITICSITLQMIDSDEVEKYWGNKIDKPGEEYEYYAYYIRLLTGQTGLCWFQNSLKNSGIQDFNFKEQKGLDLEKWIKHSNEIKKGENLPLTHTLKQIPNSKGIIIFVHGLTSDQDEEIFVQGEKFFNENGFSTIRFSLYGDLPNERKLIETCLQDNIDDTNTVIKYAKDLGFKKIFLVGHSYGCLSNLFTDLSDVSGLIMRDPSMAGEMLLSDVHEDEDGYFIDWGDGNKHRIGEKYYQDFQADPQTYLDQISKIQIPVKIFGAENGLAENARLYFDSANEPKSLTVIPGAYHRFQGGGAEELLNESLRWIESL